MKARLVVDDLLTALAAVKPAVGNRYPFVRLRNDGDGLEVAADDSQIGVTARIDSWVPLGTDGDGTEFVPYRPLEAFARHAIGTEIEMVSSETEQPTVTVADGKTHMTLATSDGEWFPNRPEPTGEVTAKLDPEVWERVRLLVPFASTDPSRGPLTGVNFLNDKAVASDSYHLGVVEADFGFEACVQADVIAPISAKDSPVELGADGRSMRLQAGGITVTTTRLAGSIAESWPSFFRDPVGHITVELAELRRACEVAAITARQAYKAGKDVRVVPNVDDGEVVIESIPDSKSPADVTRVPVAADLSGDLAPFGINLVYIDNVVRLLFPDESGDFEMHFTGPTFPLIFGGKGDRALIMPIR